jgi:mRNA interferase MazF
MPPQGVCKYIQSSHMYIKEFDAWNEIKKHVHATDMGVRIGAGEVRWASCGVNVGSEIDGKGVSFTRPVLVLHVICKTLALVIPLSTKLKEVPGYVSFEFKGKTASLCIHQARTISQRRILTRMGRISDSRLAEVKQEFKDFFNL